MSESTGIEWANHTASPWFGCTEVSPGCANCYARQLTLQKKWAGWGDSSPRVRSKGFWTNAIRWNKHAARLQDSWDTFKGVTGATDDSLIAGGHVKPTRPRIFTSLMDWLDPQVPIEWLADFLRVIRDTPNLDWLLLTKRPELWRSRLEAVCESKSSVTGCTFARDWLDGGTPPNVWMGVTCEDQKRADERVPILLGIPARVRWVSAEPLLEPINLQQSVGNLYDTMGYKHGLAPDWIVVGGESGSKRRDCGVAAIVSVAEQCKAAGVPVFVKQDTAQRPGQQGRIPDAIWQLKEFPR